ncbi:MAG: hypothetical protein AB1635_05035 [Acidobacteriota bacterium]
MRMTTALVLGVAVSAATASAQEPVPPPETQIAAAVMAAPEDRRAAATVLGYDASGAVVTLRTGTNDLVCVADNPKAPGFSVACYHKDLEPFMARGRELTAHGVTDDKIRDETRYKEIAAGKLAMSKEPRMLYVTTGKAFENGQVVNAFTRWVIYVPFATGDALGLPTRPAGEGVPWLMDPGTAGAHIMITPARAKQ